MGFLATNAHDLSGSWGGRRGARGHSGPQAESRRHLPGSDDVRPRSSAQTSQGLRSELKLVMMKFICLENQFLESLYK